MKPGAIAVLAAMTLIGAAISTSAGTGTRGIAGGSTQRFANLPVDASGAVFARAVSRPGPAQTMTTVPVAAAHYEPLVAAIHEGTCDDLSAEPVIELADVALPGEAPVEPATAVLMSDNPAVEIALDDLVEREHATAVGHGGTDRARLIVCGEIGQEGDDRERFVGLRSQNDSGVAGIARLRDNEDGTTHVTIHVAGGLTQEAPDDERAATPVATAAVDATPGAIATPVIEATPGAIATPVVEATPEAAASPVLPATPVVMRTPEATETPEAVAETPEPSQEETYESPNYGYTVTYDAAVWSVEEAEIVEDESGNLVDILRLSNGVTTAQFFGRPSTLDAERCLSGLSQLMTAEEEVKSFEPHQDGDGDSTAGGDDADAFAVFDYSQEVDGAVDDLTVYIRCQVIAEGESLLLTFLTAPEEAFAAEEAARNELLKGVELP